MKVARRYTEKGKDVFNTVEWATRSSRIANLDGSTVFEMNDAQVPRAWSQLATDIMVSKYFRKAGVPQTDENDQLQKDENGDVVTGAERSVRQVIHRLAGCWRHWGQEHGYFDTDEDAEAFYDELCHMLLHQMAAPNSPQWFNAGLQWAYGITGPAQGHWVNDPESGETKPADDAYSHPQPHACFIQSINDDLVNPGGIMDLWVREARLFKYGSGTGTNFSALRGEDEPLSGGGRSSGLMSWLKIGDRAAGAIKSGGTTRRAAKMVCLDLDHPDIEQFVDWKVREELKVAALVEGRKHLSPKHKEAADALGLNLDYDFNGEAYLTVSGQNSNNSVRIANAFFQRLDEDGQWDLINRTDGQVAKSIRARDLWDKIANAAWQCADPGVQFDTTINQWHTCPESGRINASNPCSEYMFIDNTACNLASLNLLKFFDAERRSFDVDGFEQAVRIWTIVLEISVLMAAFPSKSIARRSYDFRTLGLGYANVGAMLMQAGIPYDSDEARATCGAITAILTGQACATSAEMAAQLGPFDGHFKNRQHMLRVIRNHRRAAYNVPRDHDSASQHDLGDYEGLEIRPVGIDPDHLTADAALANGKELLDHARAAWDAALKHGDESGFRNAQTTVIAPTGTIGLLMDCDTTGVEPDFALVKFKKLAGGGYFKIANQSISPALKNLGYDQQQIKDILTHVMGTLRLDVPLPGEDGKGVSEKYETFADLLKDKGLTDDELKKLTDALPTVFELPFAFTVWTLGADAIERMGAGEHAAKGGAKLLKALGLTGRQIATLNRTICGTQAIEGAPHIKDEHLPVFDCAATCGPDGKRFIETQGHIHMMAAAQPFISGAISKTINLQNDATIEDIKEAYRLSWELGLKANALYRDGCKLSQPLSNNSRDVDDEPEDEPGIDAARQEVADDVLRLADEAGHITMEDGVKIRTVEKIVEKIVERPLRRRLPDTRKSVTHKFNVAGHEGYLTVGLYENGAPGELFITMAKEGSTIGGLMDSLGTAISVALQYGVPLESLVLKFTHQRFEPAGMTHNPDIPFAKSLVDYIFRWMGMEFVPGYRALNAPLRSADEKGESTPKRTSAAKAKAESIAKPASPAAEPVGDAPVAEAESTVDPVRRNLPLDDAEPAPPSRLAEAIAGEPLIGKAGNRDTGSKDADVVAAASTSESFGAASASGGATLAAAMIRMQADAPACDVCGTITVRNGTCYKCLNCGNSMGCS